MASVVFVLVLTAWCAFLLAVVTPALRRPTDRHIESFAEFYALPLNATTHELIAAALTWTRRWRVAGGAAGGLAWWVSHPPSTPFNPIAIAAGIAAGNLLAELTRRPPHRGTVRVAEISRRAVTDHVQRFVIVGLAALWLLAAAVVAAAATGLTMPERLPTGDLVVGLGALVLGGAALPLAGGVARRPAPRDDHTIAAVFHAIRTASISSVLGGGVIVLAAGLYHVGFVAVLEDGELSGATRHLNNAAVWIALAAMFAGIALVFGSFPRRTSRRSEALTA